MKLVDLLDVKIMYNFLALQRCNDHRVESFFIASLFIFLLCIGVQGCAAHSCPYSGKPLIQQEFSILSFPALQGSRALYPISLDGDEYQDLVASQPGKIIVKRFRPWNPSLTQPSDQACHFQEQQYIFEHPEPLHGIGFTRVAGSRGSQVVMWADKELRVYQHFPQSQEFQVIATLITDSQDTLPVFLSPWHGVRLWQDVHRDGTPDIVIPFRRQLDWYVAIYAKQDGVWKSYGELHLGCPQSIIPPRLHDCGGTKGIQLAAWLHNQVLIFTADLQGNFKTEPDQIWELPTNPKTTLDDLSQPFLAPPSQNTTARLPAKKNPSLAQIADKDNPPSAQIAPDDNLSLARSIIAPPTLWALWQLNGQEQKEWIWSFPSDNRLWIGWDHQQWQSLSLVGTGVTLAIAIRDCNQDCQNDVVAFRLNTASWLKTLTKYLWSRQVPLQLDIQIFWNRQGQIAQEDFTVISRSLLIHTPLRSSLPPPPEPVTVMALDLNHDGRYDLLELSGQQAKVEYDALAKIQGDTTPSWVTDSLAPWYEEMLPKLLIQENPNQVANFSLPELVSTKTSNRPAPVRILYEKRTGHWWLVR